jgi:membrane protease YdiL (CAAX protease family)
MLFYPATIGFFSFLILVQLSSTVVMRLTGEACVSSDRLQARRGEVIVQGIFNFQVLSLAIIVFCFYVEKPPFSDFGYKMEWNSAFSFCIGILVYAVFVSVYGLISKIAGTIERESVAAYLTHRIIWPRTKLAQKKLGMALFVNPFTEELFYRGFLVFYLGNATGFLWFFLLIGLASCLAVHAYQDLRLQFFHGAVYVVTICLFSLLLGFWAVLDFILQRIFIR